MTPGTAEIMQDFTYNYLAGFACFYAVKDPTPAGAAL